MDTRSSTELKKILETLEADKRDMVQQMKAMQDQIQALVVSQNQRPNGEGSSSGEAVNKEGNGIWHSNEIKVDIPEYDGKLDPDEFVEWLRTVERVFDYKQTTDENKVKIVALKLRKYASTWWSNVCLKRDRAGKEKIRTWLKMKTKLKQKFLPAHYIQSSFSQLHSLRQGTGTVEDYSREFEYLIMKCDIPEDDPQTLVRYLGGLEPRIANVVELQSYHTLSELTVLAHKVDIQQRGKIKKPDAQSSNYNSNQTPKSPATSITPNPDLSKAPRRCFRCQGLGHIASDCPNKRIITLTDFELSSGYEFSNDTLVDSLISKEDEEELVGPDEGECLVVRRSLHNLSAKEETLQREAIFHTRCTVAQRVCTVIIDGGSCTNVASQTLITKLSLPTKPHPSPYVIQWLNQSKGIRVSQRVLLSFSIGRYYKDEIWCDVLPMDACHVLLGRPWQFDRHAIHDGYRNTYSFTHNGRKVVLTPISHNTQSTKPPRSISALLRVGQIHDETVKKLCLVSSDDDVVVKPIIPPCPRVQHLLQPVFNVAGCVVSPTSTLVFPYFVKVFKAECHAWNVGIGADLYPYFDLGGPFKVLVTVNDNAYELNLPGTYGVSATFKVADFQPYFDPDEPIPSLRTNFSEAGEDDREDQAHNPTTLGPIQKWDTLA